MNGLPTGMRGCRESYRLWTLAASYVRLSAPMSWRFRKSFKVIPGVRLNLSRSGLSASIGGAPITLNIGQHGLVGTASLPGTGISYRHKFGTVPQDGSPALSLPPSSAPSFIPAIPAPQLHPVPVI